MSLNDIMQIVLFIAVFSLIACFLGNYMANVFSGRKHLLSFSTPLENFTYRVLKIDQERQMDWKEYAVSVGLFSIFSTILLFAILVTQNWLPLNPQKMPNLTWDLALNTSVSFATNTNWQAYSGETSLSYFSQMLGLTVQNFASAAVGMACALVLIGGIIRKHEPSRTADLGLGNFWVDMTRSILYILLPLSFILALMLVSQGVIQNLNPYITCTSLEGVKQVIPMGPAASQIAIKQLGTNGGGFFGANSAHPFENPRQFSNFLELLGLIVISAAFPFMYGNLSGKRRQGYVIFGTMLALLVAGIVLAMIAEYSYGTMEGKEMRFGKCGSVLWGVATTVTSCGAVNSMHDSFAPLTGMIPMINMMLGEIIFGGVGSGFYGMILFVVITVFLAGLMVGRSPEYMGKKIEATDVKLSMVGIMIPSMAILIFSSAAVLLPSALASRANPGPHGLSEILYAFSSGAGNNGSAFAGLNANTVFYNVSISIAMLLGRFSVIFPVLALAASLAGKKTIPASEGTFPTDTILFASLLTGVILIVGGLTHFPALTLGPILEHFVMLSGKVI
ncbi:MAG: potassium-transporting ATPase subunit KdpA [Victivallales bacterium]|jgi:K+-transporting ATPase ATPase A chain